MKQMRLLLIFVFLSLIFSSTCSKKQPSQSQQSMKDTGITASPQTDVEKLIRDIQSINDPNSEHDYAKQAEIVNVKLHLLKPFLSHHDISGDLLDEARQWGEEVKAELCNRVGIIIINGHRLGNVLFLDAATSELKLVVNLGYRVKSYKFVHNPYGHPKTLFVLRHNVITGTGTLGEAVRIYVIEDGNAVLSLMKPYYEYNTGWGAYEDEFVEFHLKNEYPIVDGAFEIRTSGVAITKNHDTKVGGMNILDDGMYIRAINHFPPERYVWNAETKKFDQVEGRKIDGELWATSVYSDFAYPKGDWFTPPAEIQITAAMENLQDFEEKWDYNGTN